MVEIAADPQKAKRGPAFIGQSMAPSTEKTRASAEGGGKEAFLQAIAEGISPHWIHLPANRAGGTRRDIQANMERLF